MSPKRWLRWVSLIVVAPGSDGEASGSLYIDDGVSISPQGTTSATMSYKNNKFVVGGQFGFKPSPSVAAVTFLGSRNAPRKVTINGSNASSTFNSTSQTVVVTMKGQNLDRGFEVDLTF